MDKSRADPAPKTKAILQVQDLQVYYGESHALQGVSLTLERGVLSVVGRNGMGKTTLCNAIVGLMPVRSGTIRFEGRDLVGLEPHTIARAGVGYVPARAAPVAESFGRRDIAAQRPGAGATGRSNGSIRSFRAWPSGARTAAASCRAANSRCWRSRGRCSAIRGFL